MGAIFELKFMLSSKTWPNINKTYRIIESVQFFLSIYFEVMCLLKFILSWECDPIQPTFPYYWISFSLLLIFRHHPVTCWICFAKNIKPGDKVLQRNKLFYGLCPFHSFIYCYSLNNNYCFSVTYNQLYFSFLFIYSCHFQLEPTPRCLEKI